MKKFLLPLTLLFVLILSACNSSSDSSSSDTASEGGDTSSAETITYESESGPVEVPADPQRVVVLGTYTGHVLALDVPVVGADSWSKDNPNYDLADAEVVSDQDVEKILELEPDLIIGLSTVQNLDKLQEIAPTVTYTYGNVDYLEQFIEIGKLLNQEEEATAWVEDFKARAQQAGEDVKAEIGEDTTVSVVENFDKQLYLYGDNWARGTEVIYQEMGLAMPEKVQELALEAGYYALSLEVLPEVAGDYMVLSRNTDQDNSFMETDTYKNIPAVKNGQVFEVNGKEWYFNDPITLDLQLDYLTDAFLGE